MKLQGPYKITVLESGDFRLDGGAMMGSVPKVLWEKENPADDKNRIALSLRCLLLDNGVNRILIETGMGPKISDKFRSMYLVDQPAHPLMERLAQSGYSMADITHVINTHLHFDHCGGNTVNDGKGAPVPAFPNARYCIARSNWEAAVNPNPRDRASYIQENYLPLERHGVLDLVDDNAPVMEGISTITVNGHTFGQQLIKITNADETILFCGDLVPLKSHVRLPWIMGYDLNALLTLQEKTAILKQAADDNWWLFFTHDPDTVAVRIARGEKGYEITEEVRRKC
jgi:glyoxylase-like metal-dependent hydrolase (beta-lactamase superfamily II)